MVSQNGLAKSRLPNSLPQEKIQSPLSLTIGTKRTEITVRSTMWSEVLLFSSTISFWVFPALPTGTTMRPPRFSWAVSAAGISGGAAVTLATGLVAIHFGGQSAVWRAAETARQGRVGRIGNMAATGRSTWEACSTHQHSRAPHLRVCNRRRRRRSTTHKNGTDLEGIGVLGHRRPAGARHAGKRH